MSKRLLICDDSSFSRKSIRKAVPDGLDLEIAEAASGEDALATCAAGNVDLLFLDLNMPGLDGFDVLERLQASDFAAPIIVITANIQSAPAKRAKELGARAVVQKPISEEKLSQLMTYLASEGAI